MAEQIEWADFAGNVAGFIGTDAAGLTMDTALFDDLGIDSLGMFSLGLFLIKTYGGHLPIASVASIQTIGDIFTTLGKSRENNS